ncbi:MAG: hypothetical protein JSU92_01140 [Deltaproteobacteria bacterium]|nr:MAG: hypothetical protein JSU92_01140 [Deltaproteobacteria bacterium]
MKKKIGTIMEEDILNRAKWTALKEGKKLNQLIEDALESYIKEKDKGRRDKSIVQATKGVFKVNKKVVDEILRQEPFYEI